MPKQPGQPSHQPAVSGSGEDTEVTQRDAAGNTEPERWSLSAKLSALSCRSLRFVTCTVEIKTAPAPYFVESK